MPVGLKVWFAHLCEENAAGGTTTAFAGTCMTDDGPQMANIALKGVFDRKGLDPTLFGAYDRKGAETEAPQNEVKE